ncbi:MAG TPA: hypothetical protein PLG60_03390, partial [Acidimicrobiales bacterium]|nr:hypothetical protein [Acidimicrobiales bacterium]
MAAVLGTVMNFAVPVAGASTGVAALSVSGSSQVAFATSTWTFTFTPTTSLGVKSTFTFGFPSNFTVPSSPTVALVSGFTNCSGGLDSRLVDTYKLSGNSCTVAAGSPASFTVSGITNGHAGSYSGFTIQTSSDTTVVSATATISGAGSTVGAVTFSGATQVAHQSTNWTAGFTSSSSGALVTGDNVYVTFPSSFTVPASPAVTFASGFTGTCNGTTNGSTSSNVVTVPLTGSCALASSTAASIVVGGVTNPVAGSYAASSFGVQTSEDATAIGHPSSNVVIGAAGTTVSSVNFSGSPQNSGATATWTAGFTSSSAGALSAGDVVKVTLPSSFTVPASPSVSFASGFGGTCTGTTTGSTTSNVVTISLTGSCTLANSTAATVTIAGITNPSAGSYAATGFGVATSEDATSVVNPPSSITISAGSSVTGLSFSGSSQVAHASATTWTVNFTPTSSLSAGSSVEAIFPASFTIGASPTVTLSSEFATEGCALNTSFVSGASVSFTLTNASSATCSATSSHALSFTVNTITNPVAGAYTNGYALVTSTDTAQATASAAISGAGSGATSVTESGASQSAHASTSWTAGFKTSSGGALGAGDTISIAYPSAFTVPVSPAVTFGAAFTGTCSGTTNGSTVANVVTITLSGTCALAASTSATVVVAGITNPAAGSYAASGFTVATSEDAGAVPSAAEVISATGSAVNSVTYTGNPGNAGATSAWTVGFSTSSSGALSSGDTISIAFPSAFTVPASPVISSVAGFSGSCSGTTGTTISNVITFSITGTCALAGGTAASVTISGITNPAAGSYAATGFTVKTSEDPTPTSPPSAVTISAGSVVTSVSFNGSSVVAHATGTTWTVGFTPTNSLGSGSSVTFALPSGFVIGTGAVLTLGSEFSNEHCGLNATTITSPSVKFTLSNSGGGCSATSAYPLSLTISTVTNPSAGQYLNQYTVTTSADTATAVSSTTITGSGTVVSSVTFSGSPATAHSTSSWTASFKSSSSGALATGDTISIAFPTAFSVPASPGVTFGGSFAGTCTNTTTGSTVANVVTVTLSGTCTLANSATGTIV